MASSMAEKENISMGTEARASGDSVGDHPKDKGKKHPVVIADLMKILDPARSKLDDRGLALTVFPETSEECKAVVARIGYDELVKVLIDCEVRLGSKVPLAQLEATLQAEPLALSQAESRAVARALHEKDDLVRRSLNVARFLVKAIDEGTKKVVSGADKLLATKMESAVGKIHKGAEAAREKLHEGAELAKQGAKGALAGVEAAADRAVTGAKDVASGVHGDSQLFGSKKLKQLVTAVTNPEQAQGSISGPPPEEKSDKMFGSRRLAGIRNVLFPPDQPGDLGIVGHGTKESSSEAQTEGGKDTVDATVDLPSMPLAVETAEVVEGVVEGDFGVQGAAKLKSSAGDAAEETTGAHESCVVGHTAENAEETVLPSEIQGENAKDGLEEAHEVKEMLELVEKSLAGDAAEVGKEDGSSTEVENDGTVGNTQGPPEGNIKKKKGKKKNK